MTFHRESPPAMSGERYSVGRFNGPPKGRVEWEALSVWDGVCQEDFSGTSGGLATLVEASDPSPSALARTALRQPSE